MICSTTTFLFFCDHWPVKRQSSSFSLAITTFALSISPFTNHLKVLLTTLNLVRAPQPHFIQIILLAVQEVYKSRGYILCNMHTLDISVISGSCRSVRVSRIYEVFSVFSFCFEIGESGRETWADESEDQTT